MLDATTLFTSTKEYGAFILAKGFKSASAREPFLYRKNWLEKIGDWMVLPTFGAIDQTLKGIRNPLVLTSMGVTALALLTIAYYPAEFSRIATTALPPLRHVTPGKLQLTLYVVATLTNAGVVCRSIGRFSCRALMEAWQLKDRGNRRSIAPIPLGTAVIRG